MLRTYLTRRCILTIMNHAQAEWRHTVTYIPPRRLSATSHVAATSIFDRLVCVQIYDLYFTWDSGAEEVEEFAVLGVHDGSLDELHHRMAAVLKLRMTPQAERPWRWTEMFFLICHM